MQKIEFDRDWEFCKEQPALYFVTQGFAGKQTVHLPHDMDICEEVDKSCPDGAQKGFYRGNYGVYTKYFDAPQSWRNKHVFLEFDGSFGNTEITLNGHLLAVHTYGYSPFSVELTDYLLIGKRNRLAVFVNNSAQYTARWYSGSGLYRHVRLRVGGAVYLPVDPIFAYTEQLDKERACVAVKVQAVNATQAACKVRALVELCEDKGHGKPCGKTVASGESTLYLPANADTTAIARIILRNPKVWDVDNPHLYRVRATLFCDGKKIDADETLFGVRTLSLDVQNGLRLNGKTVKIKGGCVHHDNGILGAKSFYDSEYRRLKLHKDNGFNGIRCAHNPMSAEMMEACDRLGLLVFAEAFDVWNMQKNMNDYHVHFADWWERDLTAFIKRDRNHPSVFCWSIGNEVGERNGLRGGAEYARKLSAKVRELDGTRFVTAAVPTMFNGMNDEDTVCQLTAMQKLGGYAQNLSTPWSQEHWAERTEAFCAPLDFVGYNYLEMRYERDSEQFPERIICGTESYPAQIDTIWEKVERMPNVIGDFVWTSHDYIGETGCGNIHYVAEGETPITVAELRAPAYPHRTANCGNFDVLGHGLPPLHYHKIVWGSNETYIAVCNPAHYGKTAYRTSWAWDDCDNRWKWKGYEGKPIHVEVYSAADEVELIINGKSEGRAPAGKTEHFRAKFDAVYIPGTITAISYTNGKEVSRQTLTTAGDGAGICLCADKKELVADGQSLAFVDVFLVDDNGNIVPDCDALFTAEVTGAASLAAFGSANPVTEENYTSGSFTSYRGRLMAVVRSGYEAGEAVLRIKSEKYGAVEISVKIK